jgi:hypothetical protein
MGMIVKSDDTIGLVTSHEDAKQIREVTVVVNETRVVAMVHDEVLELEQFALVEFVKHFGHGLVDCFAVRLGSVFSHGVLFQKW